MPEPQTKLLRDLDFYVVATPYSHRVSFVIYEVVGYTDGAPCFSKKGSSAFDPVATVEEAEPFAHGDVKWDGCSDWHFDECDRNMIHGCFRRDLVNVGLLLGECWDMAETILGKTFIGVS